MPLENKIIVMVRVDLFTPRETLLWAYKDAIRKTHEPETYDLVFAEENESSKVIRQPYASKCYHIPLLCTPTFAQARLNLGSLAQEDGVYRAFFIVGEKREPHFEGYPELYEVHKHGNNIDLSTRNYTVHTPSSLSNHFSADELSSLTGLLNDFPTSTYPNVSS